MEGDTHRFGLVTSTSLDELLAACVRHNGIFRTLVRRVRDLLATEALREAPLALQIETEVEIEQLLREIETSVYGSSAHDFAQRQDTGERVWECVEAGIAHIPRQIQFVRGLHERLTELHRRLPGDFSTLPDWGDAWSADQQEQVQSFRSLLEFEADELQLEASVADMLQTELSFWMRRQEELILELRELMVDVSQLIGEASKVNTVEEIGVPVKPDKEDWKIPPREVRVEFHEGGGLYRGQWLDTPVDVRKITDPENAFFKREAKLWGGLSHPNVTNLMGVCESEGGGQCFITEPGELGNLVKYLTTGPDDPKDVWQKLYEVALALEYLHERGIVHDGIKPDNV